MSADLQRRREELAARRAKLSATQQAQLEQRLGSAESPAVREKPAALIPLQVGAAGGRPLFLLHAVNGDVACYVELARRLDPDRPCYGLQAARVASVADVSLEELARVYMTIIKAKQPDGPYWLGGWSLGGVIAFEIAQQLRAQDQAVALLALIDSQVNVDQAVVEPPEAAVETIGFALAQGLPLRFGGDAQASIEQQYAQAVTFLRGLSVDEQLITVLTRAQQARLLPAAWGLAQIQQEFQTYLALARALRQYRPRPYAGAVTWFRADEQFSPQVIAPASDWAALTSELRVQSIPGNHYTVLREPHVQTLAARLQACL